MARKVKPRICRTNEISIPIDTEECVLWLNPVQSVEDIKNPTRDYAWITPDNTVYVFNGHKIVPIFSTNDSHIKWGHVDGDIKDQKDLYEILLKTVNGVKQNGTELPKDLEQKVNVSVPIMHIKVNNTELEPNNYTVNIDLTSYAKTSDIPTKLSQLANDTGYITPETESDSVHTITFNGNLLNPDAQKNITINVRTLTSTSVSYQISDSKSTSPTGDWVTSVPTLEPKHPYLWTKFVHTYSDNTSETSYTIATTLDGIQVGGRNLVTGTSETEATGDYPNENYIQIFQKPMTVNATEETYTLSFKAKSTVSGDLIQTLLHGDGNPNVVKKVEMSNGMKNTNHPDGDAPFAITTEYVKYWVKYTITPATYPLVLIVGRLSLGNGTGTVSVKDIKLEAGNTPTDWTPAPEDLEAYTDTKATEINENISSNIETSTTASKTYTEGTYVSVNGKLKKVTSTIGQGSQFNSLNSQDTTIADELKSWSGESYKETVLGSSTKTAYVHDVTLSEDPSNFDYLIILVTGGASNNKRMCYAKKHGDTWYTNSSPTDYRHLGVGINSQSGTSMRITVAEWESKSVNSQCAIDSIIGVKF